MVDLVDGALGGTAAVLAMDTIRKMPFYAGYTGHQGNVVQVVDPKMQLKFRLCANAGLAMIGHMSERQ
jgi:hypothetical protein